LAIVFLRFGSKGTNRVLSKKTKEAIGELLSLHCSSTGVVKIKLPNNAKEEAGKKRTGLILIFVFGRSTGSCQLGESSERILEGEEVE
jgi:hypothetical protein